MLSLALSFVLHGAPLAINNGDFIGWTADGETYAWSSTQPDGSRVIEWRSPASATGEVFIVEEGGKPGPGALKYDEWKKTHPLTKAARVEGVTTTIKVDGKPNTTFGGTGKAFKLELIAEKGKAKATGKSLFVDAFGKKLRKGTVAPFVDPTGRRVVFVIAFEDGKGEPKGSTGELIEVALPEAK
ncbi:MAG: hypothetical protein U0228_35285 [Myxococcaceae bacterium]